MDRESRIIRTSILSIAINIVLVLVKLGVGFLSNSIAIILDAVNNLSDALSSVITIVGARLSNRRPDKKHPYGYGRVEYLASVVISALVLIAGGTSLRESVDKIIHPEAATYTAVTFVLIGVAIVVKFLMGSYVKKTGKVINAQSLIASGTEAFFDAVLSAATLAAAVISILWQVHLEGWLGAVISLLIIKSAVELLLETLNHIVGQRADKELTDQMKALIGAHKGVIGVYDVTLHNYGPTRSMGSVHIEVADLMTAREIHRLSRQITQEIADRLGIVLTVGIYASNDSTKPLAALKQLVMNIVFTHPEVLQLHGFYVDEETRQGLFDLVIDFKADAPAVRARILEELAQTGIPYRFDIVLDADYSD